VPVTPLMRCHEVLHLCLEAACPDRRPLFSLEAAVVCPMPFAGVCEFTGAVSGLAATSP
jgi:hypothetical protein